MPATPAVLVPLRRDGGSNDQARLAALFELYMYDFSEFLGLEIGDDGRFHPPDLGAYFGDAGHHGFFIYAGDQLGGFALVSQRSRITDRTDVYDVNEFFVLRRYRRRGVGHHAAQALFARFAGNWEVRQKNQNTAAIAFWRATIAAFTAPQAAGFEESIYDNDRWRGPVQRFVSMG